MKSSPALAQRLQPTRFIAVGALLGVAAAHAPSDASAQSRRFELGWHAPPECPKKLDVEREIEDLTSGALSSPAAPVLAEAEITNQAAGFALKLTMGAAESARTRSIGAPTCEELAHATALIVAIAVDPSILERRIEPSVTTQARGSAGVPFDQMHCRLTDLPQASPPPASAPCPVRDVAAPVQTKSIEMAPERPFWRLGLGSFAALGVLPQVNFGMNILGAAQGKWARLELSASMLSAAKESRIAGRSADFSLYRLTPRACPSVSTRWFSAGPCFGIEFGLLTGHGNGVSSEYDPKAFWLASTFGGMFELRLGSSTLFLVTAELSVPWLRTPFELAGERLYRPSESGSFGVSLAAGWP